MEFSLAIQTMRAIRVPETGRGLAPRAENAYILCNPAGKVKAIAN